MPRRSFDHELDGQSSRRIVGSRVTRRHKDGTVELILCTTDSTIRYFGVDEDQAYNRMSVHLRGTSQL
jgi:hypothetical protein